jgi:hypothetical protein
MVLEYMSTASVRGFDKVEGDSESKKQNNKHAGDEDKREALK